MPPAIAAEDLLQKREAGPVLAYFTLYLSYLFIRLEGEMLHWLTLVAIPLVVMIAMRRCEPAPFLAALRSVGLRWGGIARGLIWAILLGFGISLAQLWASRNRAQILATLQSPRALGLVSLTFLLMLLFAGFTEEFFFRGVVQRRLQALVPGWIAVLVTAVLFGLYHLPYAYLHPRWPSHGDWPAALSAAFGQGIPAGIILGSLYLRSGNNLLACAVCHALINLLPGMLQIKFGS